MMVVVLGAGSFEKTVPAKLDGTAWHGVTLTSAGGAVSEGTAVAYEIEFRDEGLVRIKLDCNTAAGSYTAREHDAGQGDLTIGALRMTRAMCPPGSLSPVIAGQLGAVHGYIVTAKSLTLTLSDGGTLVWQRAN
jgi:heat shock protein HslJ